MVVRRFSAFGERGVSWTFIADVGKAEVLLQENLGRGLSEWALGSNGCCLLVDFAEADETLQHTVGEPLAGVFVADGAPNVGVAGTVVSLGSPPLPAR